MIRVDRARAGPAGQVIAPNTAWQQRAAAKTALALQEGSQHIADGNVYGGDTVRAALEALFFDKCAYCEIPTSWGFDWDVEHFRPKGRVAENANHPGYYWLTYAWTNLYPSCTHCNQRRRDRPRLDNPETGGVSGKVDRFPLADEATRAMGPNEDIAAEARLLVDPCGPEDPEAILALGANGLFVAIQGDPRGKKTIDVFGLNRRRRLVDARRIWIRKLLAAVATTNDRDHLLAVFAEPDTPFAAIARAMRRDPAAFGL